ncbi:hypothetical protein Tco_0186408 [Tanacetum coccineum]
MAQATNVSMHTTLDGLRSENESLKSHYSLSCASYTSIFRHLGRAKELEAKLSMPYREGFGAFAWRIPILVIVSKTVLRHSKLFEGKIIITIFLIMSAKDSITIQTCELSKEEFNDFLTLYPIPSEYRVILPKSNQTVFDAPPGYVGLYTHSFSLTNLRLSLTEFFGEVLEYFQHLGRYTTSVRVFPDAIPFLAGLKPSREYVQQRPAIMAGDKDSRESPKPKLFVVHPGSVAAWIKDRKCKTRGGSSRPPVKRKLAPESSTSRATRAKTSSSKDDAPFLTVSDDDEGLSDVLELKDATVYHLKIFTITPPAWKNHLDNHIDVELLDLHDHYYARQAVVDNAVNRSSHELLQVIEKLRGEFDVMKNRERAREEECEGLWVKCEAAMTEFKKNPAVDNAGESEVGRLSIKPFEFRAEGYFLEAKKARLEAVEVSPRKEVEELRQDRREVVSKFIPYAMMELVHSDDMVKGYRSSYKKDHTQASNDFAIATFPWLDEFVADPSAPIEVLLLKKLPSLQRHVPSRTQIPLPTSQRATPSSAPVSNLMSPPAYASVVKPQSSPL